MRRPTVILQDHPTFSAAEDFLVAADEIPRILTMGQVSGGSTGNPIFWQLPRGQGTVTTTLARALPVSW